MEKIEEVIKRELYADTLVSLDPVAFISGAIRGGGEISFTKKGFQLSFDNADKRFIEHICGFVYLMCGYKCETYQHNIDDENRFGVTFPLDISREILLSCFIFTDSYTVCDGIPPILLENKKKRQSFLCGLFLSCGTLQVPEDQTVWESNKTKKGYKLTFFLNSDLVKKDVVDLLCSLPFLEKEHILTSERGNAVFVKSCETICLILGFIGSNEGVLLLHEVITTRKMKNDLNRAMNFDMANIDKKVRTAARQVVAVKELDRKVGIDRLSEDLRVTCRLRLENPEAGLAELANMFTPPVSKSCINHRMRKIMELSGLAD